MLQEISQYGEILLIPFIHLLCLKHFRNRGKVFHDVAKSIQANLAFPDMFMTIKMRTEIAF